MKPHKPHPLCLCTPCHEMREIAVRLVDRGVDLRDLVEEIRPFVLAEREKRNPARPQNLNGGPTVKAHGGAGDYGEGEDSPWHENAVGAMEDGGPHD